MRSVQSFVLLSFRSKHFNLDTKSEGRLRSKAISHPKWGIKNEICRLLASEKHETVQLLMLLNPSQSTLI